jgi:dihydroorotase
MLKYDLLLKGGEVIDPAQGLRAVRDVAFRDGKVASVEAGIPVGEAREIIDVTGKLVTPGLVDIHGHYFNHFFSSATDADDACLPTGVTTSVDAGSSGWLHFDAFKEYILSKQETRLYALINLSSMGMYSMGGDFGPTIGIGGGPQTLLPDRQIGELQDLRYAQVQPAVDCIKDNANVALGVKVRIDTRISGEANSIPCLERGRQVADLADSFMMVHVARTPIPLAKVLEYMRPGDIVTHCFHSAENNVLDAQGNIRPEVLEARAKGILMDVGAVRYNFGVEVSRAAIEQGFPPDTLGTDMSRRPDGEPIAYSVPDLMSMYMGLGMTLDEVVAAATSNGARAIGQEGVLGTLKPGAAGDAAVLEMEEGEFKYDDADGALVKCGQRVNPVMTIVGGRRWQRASDD